MYWNTIILSVVEVNLVVSCHNPPVVSWRLLFSSSLRQCQMNGGPHKMDRPDPGLWSVELTITLMKFPMVCKLMSFLDLSVLHHPLEWWQKETVIRISCHIRLAHIFKKLLITFFIFIFKFRILWRYTNHVMWTLKICIVLKKHFAYWK